MPDLRIGYAVCAVAAGVGALSAAVAANFGWFLVFVGLVLLSTFGYQWCAG